jgi:crossover junction endodeoxyribonuclease RuvC
MSGALILGVDPGITGAFALLAADGSLIAVQDLPVIRHGRLAWIDAEALTSRLMELRAGRELHAMVEGVHAMPRNGSQAAFSQGATLGSILAALQVLQARIELVTPQSWKRTYNLSSEKSLSLDRARLLFPDADLDRKRDHNRAEAILIAQYARQRRAA